MADTIKIGNYEVSCFKVGSSDCKIYLGDTLLYPQSTTPNYFRFVAREDGQFKLSGNSISYSLDSGETWTSLASDTYSPTVSSGSYIMFKATNPTLISNNGIGRFISSGLFDVEGNVMSLLYGDDFETATTITNVGQFRSLFDSNANVVNASGMTLPATTISQDAYRSMFHSASNLVTAPTELLATTLGESCCKYMFRYCSSLTTVPTLLATNLAQSCYSYMFDGCSSITTAPVLSATTMQRQCYEYMFRNCTSLTTAPDLPATTLAYQSNRYMFYGCTSLNYIKCLATDISATQCTTNWVSGVSSSGTFTKASSMTGWGTGANGIPSGWNVYNYS